MENAMTEHDRSGRGDVAVDRTYSATELAEVAAGMRRLLDAIGAGELSADSGTVARLEGAAAALDALARGTTGLSSND
jgi:hypothetical protein